MKLKKSEQKLTDLKIITPPYRYLIVVKWQE
jgi:hypothetical protein